MPVGGWHGVADSSTLLVLLIEQIGGQLRV